MVSSGLRPAAVAGPVRRDGSSDRSDVVMLWRMNPLKKKLRMRPRVLNHVRGAPIAGYRATSLLPTASVGPDVDSLSRRTAMEEVP